jgi:NitT/TauT family transport system substrate-binding protein
MSLNLSRAVRAVGLAAAALVGLVAPGPAQAQNFRMILTETTTPLVPNSVIELAHALGYYGRNNVNVELVRVTQTPAAMAGLLSGQGQMANVSVDAVLQLVARDQAKLKAVTSPNKSLPFLIGAKDTLANLKALEGRSFGIAAVGSLDHSMSRLVMQRAGVDISKVNFVNIGVPNVRAQALAAGRIDATTVSIGVWMTIPEKQGLKVLVPEADYYTAAPILNKVNIVSEDMLRTRGAQVRGVVAGIIQASRDFAREPKRWVDAMVKERPDVKREDLETLGEAFKQSWSVNGGLNLAEISYTTEWNYERPEFKDLRRVAATEWVDTSVIDSILRDIGVQAGGDPTGR